jgi:hypothetical protein
MCGHGRARTPLRAAPTLECGGLSRFRRRGSPRRKHPHACPSSPLPVGAYQLYQVERLNGDPTSDPFNQQPINPSTRRVSAAPS